MCLAVIQLISLDKKMPNRAYVWQRNVPTTPFAAAGYMATAANPLEAALGRLNPNRGRRQQTPKG